MPHRALVLMVVVVVPVVVGCRGGSARVTKLLGGSESYRAIAEAKSAEAYRVDGMGRQGKTDAKGRIKGYPVLSGPVAVDAAAAGRLAAVLTDDDTYLWDIAKACEFLPGVAVRYKTEAHEVDVLLCFSCDEVEIYRDGKRVGHEDFDPQRAELISIARALFPADKAIQALK